MTTTQLVWLVLMVAQGYCMGTLHAETPELRRRLQRG